MIRLVRSLLTRRCPLCRCRTRNIAAHLYVEHADGA
jgi:hypothetical protein